MLKLSSRKYTPHRVEVETVQEEKVAIYHKINFPDDSDMLFEVDSTTRSRDLIHKITERLRLRFSNGFSLFVRIADKVRIQTF